MSLKGYEGEIAAVQVPPELQQLKDVLIRQQRDIDQRLAALEG